MYFYFSFRNIVESTPDECSIHETQSTVLNQYCFLAHLSNDIYIHTYVHFYIYIQQLNIFSMKHILSCFALMKFDIRKIISKSHRNDSTVPSHVTRVKNLHPTYYHLRILIRVTAIINA